ncbi:NADH:flavin oxidoreductase/NADH oxidase [Halomarina ordinaria]|uniref:NADH:flavin oxidoreductase/NADH oxidase n=1 Tax=Halomarina ordinaria TaxID=3033939 RepID=A0ABD5UAP8_9EURY|nr:NADH:flavin oxidoreductase/NADH oxidase [Halomarina sp. PSRA2]
MSDLFTPLTLRETEIPNRVMVSPMCQYSCDGDGLATDWHHVHLGSRAVGGAGIVMTEAAAVDSVGRISPQDLGIWSQEHADALAPTVEFVREQGSVPAIQLAHAGRKAATHRPFADESGPVHGTEGWTPVGPTDVPYPHDDPHEVDALDQAGIEAVIEDFRRAAELSLDAGFEIAEVHGAHGYLLHEFYSPVTNTREDDYGGDYAGRTRLIREVTAAVREVWPDDRPVFVRLSATDWLPDRESWTVDDTVRLSADLKEVGADLVDVSGGGIHPDQRIPGTGAHYQVPYAERVRSEADVRTGAVGKITTPEGADEVVRNGRADLAILAREHLRDPYFTLHAAKELDRMEAVTVPGQYERGI